MLFTLSNPTIFVSLSLPLEVMTLHPVCESVETAEGVPLYVTGVSQIKVMKDPDFIGRAVEQFLGKSSTEIGEIVLQTLEGHLRAILGKIVIRMQNL